MSLFDSWNRTESRLTTDSILLSSINEVAQILFEQAIESLYLAIGLRMVTWEYVQACPQEEKQFSLEGTNEPVILVTDNASWNSPQFHNLFEE